MRLKGVCTIFGAILGVCIGCFSQGVTAAQQTPEELAQLWIEAIKENSTARIRPLIHPACPQNSIAPEILARMVGGGLPETTSTPEDKAKYGLGKGFPIARASEAWFFVICIKST